MLLLYDNTYAGFLSAVFKAFGQTKEEIAFVKEKNFVPPVLFEVQQVATNEQQAKRVANGLQKLHPQLPKILYKAWLSEGISIDQAIYQTMRLGFKIKNNPLSLLQNDWVKQTMLAQKKVSLAVERGYQFVRFTKFTDSFYIADLEPEYDILPLIGQHFHARFAEANFIIRDKIRRTAIISNKNGWQLVELSPEQINLPLAKNDEYTRMWQSYFKVLANPQRYNTKLQQKFVPLKHRKYLTEFK